MKKRANVLKVTFFYFNNHLPNKETNEKCLEKQRNQTKNRKTSPQQGNQRKLLRKTSPQQGNQRKALLDLAAARLVKRTSAKPIKVQQFYDLMPTLRYYTNP